MSARAHPDLLWIWSSLPLPYGPGTSIHMSWQSWGTNMHKKEHQQIVRAPAASGLLTHETANLQVLHQPCHDRAPHCQDVCQANKKIVCPKMWFQGHELAPRAVASQKFHCPGTWPFHLSIAVRQLHLLHLHGKPSRAGNPFHLRYHPRSE